MSVDPSTPPARRDTAPPGSEPHEPAPLDEPGRAEAEVVHLRRALESRTRIATAVGVLAGRHGCTTDQAWALLARASSHTNTKIREVARVVVGLADGTLDESDSAVVEQLTAHLPRPRPRGRPALAPGASTRPDGGPGVGPTTG